MAVLDGLGLGVGTLPGGEGVFLLSGSRGLCPGRRPGCCRLLRRGHGDLFLFRLLSAALCRLLRRGTRRLFLVFVVLVLFLFFSAGPAALPFGLALRSRLFLFVVKEVVILILVPVLSGLAENDGKREDDGKHRDKDVRKIENGEVDELQFEHVLDIAVEDAVQAV